MGDVLGISETCLFIGCVKLRRPAMETRAQWLHKELLGQFLPLDSDFAWWIIVAVHFRWCASAGLVCLVIFLMMLSLLAWVSGMIDHWHQLFGPFYHTLSFLSGSCFALSTLLLLFWLTLLARFHLINYLYFLLLKPWGHSPLYSSLICCHSDCISVSTGFLSPAFASDQEKRLLGKKGRLHFFKKFFINFLFSIQVWTQDKWELKNFRD